jgi:hypothetical protein
MAECYPEQCTWNTTAMYPPDTNINGQIVSSSPVTLTAAVFFEIATTAALILVVL